MSNQRIAPHKLEPIIKKMLEESAAKPRKFKETIELQIGLQNYCPIKERRFSGIIQLPHPTKLNYKVIVFGDSEHCNEAKQLGVDFMSVDALRSINKNRKIVKKIAQSYNAILSSESIIRQIPRLLGPGLSRAGKFPSSLSHQESLDRKIRALQCSVRFQMKKVLCLAVAVGNVTLTVQQVIENVIMTINFLVSLLRRKWRNIKSLHLKTSMGKPHRIF